MKQFILLAFISLLIVLPDMQKAVLGQQAPQKWFIVFEEKAVQGDRVQFFRKQKKAFDVWKSYHPEMPLYVWQSDDHVVYRLIPVFGFASIDTLYHKMEQVSAILNAGDGQESPSSLSTVSGSVIVWVPELSHQQSAEFDEYPDKPYTEWMFTYLISGQEQQAEEALQKFREYYTRHRLDYPWDIFRVLFGKDTPLLIGQFRAKSRAALQAKGEKIWQKHGAELEGLWEEVERHAWKIETKTGWFNPSLSNLPVVSPVEEIVESEQ